MKANRILATAGLALMVISLLCMLCGMFTGAARELLMQIALLSFLGAAGILLALKAAQKQNSPEDADPKDK